MAVKKRRCRDGGAIRGARNGATLLGELQTTDGFFYDEDAGGDYIQPPFLVLLAYGSDVAAIGNTVRRSTPRRKSHPRDYYHHGNFVDERGGATVKITCEKCGHVNVNKTHSRMVSHVNYNTYKQHTDYLCVSWRWNRPWISSVTIEEYPNSYTSSCGYSRAEINHVHIRPTDLEKVIDIVRRSGNGARDFVVRKPMGKGEDGVVARIP